MWVANPRPFKYEGHKLNIANEFAYNNKSLTMNVALAYPCNQYILWATLGIVKATAKRFFHDYCYKYAKQIIVHIYSLAFELVKVLCIVKPY